MRVLTYSKSALAEFGLHAAALLFTAVMASGAVVLGLLPVFLVLALFGLILLAAVKPVAAIIVWLSVTILLPEWTRIGLFGLSFEPATFAGLPVVAGLAVAGALHAQRVRPQFHWCDGAFFLGMGLILTQFGQGWIGASVTKEAALVWLIAYVLGRQSTRGVQRAFVILMTVAAVWGIFEFVLDLHVFESWRPAAWHTWNLIQYRAGYSRSEVTFGHGIAYGASLAMALSFAQRMRFGSLIQLVLCAGILTSLSRGPMIAAILTLALTTLFLARGRFRLWAVIPLLVGGYAVVSVMSFLYSGSNASDSISSTYAREVQFTTYFNSLRFFSTSLDRIIDDTIDSTPLRLAVNFGILTALLLLMPVFLAIWNLLSGYGGPASAALAGQVPVLIVTSLILQWSVLIFVLMGMVVTERINSLQQNPFSGERKSAASLQRI